jgi:hypothetical protein
LRVFGQLIDGLDDFEKILFELLDCYGCVGQPTFPFLLILLQFLDYISQLNGKMTFFLVKLLSKNWHILAVLDGLIGDKSRSSGSGVVL